jgi:RecJ-like exonuclease
MHTIENKFEVGEVCYSTYRKHIPYTCPICEGKGKFQHNGYDIHCKNCNGTGKLHNSQQYIMEPCKVKVKRIIASIWSNHISIKYKVDAVDDYSIPARNRGEASLFKTLEEAEEYCKGVNIGEITPEF